MKNHTFLLFILFWAFGSPAAPAQATLVFDTKLLKLPDTVVVYTPRGYHPADSVYPVVYMLHGLGGNYRSFKKILNPQQYADEYRFIIVLPDGLKDSWYIDDPHPSGNQWESFFVKELYPEIKADYPVDSARIFITGYSMGGHGALYLYLRHSRLFAAAAASSAVASLHASHARYLSLSNLLGEYDRSKAVFDKYSAVNQLDSIRFEDKPLFIDCGNKDYLLDCNMEFYEKCMDYYLPANFMEMPGRHNYDYWRSSFPFHFSFFARQTVITH